MDWEHTYYQNNANANKQPTKAYYLDVLQHQMGDCSREDVEGCMAAYHAAEDGPSSGTDETNSPDNASYLTEYPSIGGSNWFNNSCDRDYKDEPSYHVSYHHLTTKPTSKAKHHRTTESTNEAKASAPPLTTPSTPEKWNCRRPQCGREFESRNKLYSHLRCHERGY
jgi:hypothetical protein